MSVIILECDNKVIVTNEDEMTKKLHEMYEKNGNGLDKENFYYENFYLEHDAINGRYFYSCEKDCIEFEYTDWDTKLTYWHIETCIEWLDKNKESKYSVGFDKSSMFYVLMALNACGAIGKREYEALDTKYCSYE